MTKIFALSIVAAVIFSCNGKIESTDKVSELPVISDSANVKNFEMYEFSEMASLMENMFAKNKKLKENIIQGKDLGDFQDTFLKIHSAAMTDESDNDAFFQEQAKIFIAAQQMIFLDKENAKEHFNSSISACISCHQEKCGGPIPRIKTLFIK